MARYIEQVIANHSEEYPALKIVQDEIEGKDGNWLEIVGEVDDLDWDLFVGEAEPDGRRFLTLHHVAGAIAEMCEFVRGYKWEED